MWMGPNAGALADAYARHNDGVRGQVRQALLTRAIELHAPAGPQRVVDVGGGEGHQAIALARRGHRVVLLDPDPRMLRAAAARLEEEAPAVRDRVELVLGYGEQAAGSVGAGAFDIVCCHGILMYVDDPAALLASVAALARPGGLLSVVGLNRAALAMRPALSARWGDAVRAMTQEVDPGGNTLECRADDRAGVERMLATTGAEVIGWYGIRVFSDHLPDESVSGLGDLLELEWLAGCRGPYRDVARLFHILATRS
jgi:SAM-dependent methyltransferase